jgi:hypothetical protein
MKLSSIALLLDRKITPSEISQSMRAELAEHVKGLSVVGGVASVYVSEDADVLLNESGVALLCELFLSQELTAQEIAYIADILQMSDRLDIPSAWVADALSKLTDPEINGPLTVERAQVILRAAG